MVLRAALASGLLVGVIALTGLAAMLGALFILDDRIFNGLAISLIFGIFVFSSRRVANCVGPRGMELFVAVCETFVVLSLYVTSPWYITKIHGVDPWVAEWS